MNAPHPTRSLPHIAPLFAWLLALAPLVALGIYQVWQEHQVFEIGAALRVETSRHNTLIERQRKLSLEYSVLKRAADIETRATDELGMAVPEDRDYVVVTPHRPDSGPQEGAQ